MRKLIDKIWAPPLAAATLWTAAAFALYFEKSEIATLTVVLGLLALYWVFQASRPKRRARVSAGFLGLGTVIPSEKKQIDMARRDREADSPRAPDVGLALSGGGIRSATFNLGLLQALADLHLLSRIDYLSTVSGGGYIGSWLMQWVRRAEPRIADRDPTSENPPVEAAHDSVSRPVEDPALAAMLLVAWGDSNLSKHEISLIKAALKDTPDDRSLVSDPPPSSTESDAWLEVVKRANADCSQHEKARLASLARRIVDFHRQQLHWHSTLRSARTQKRTRAEKRAEREAANRRRAELQAAVKRTEGALAQVERALRLRGIDKVESALADDSSVARPEPRPVSHLREFSNYLTPEVGLLTADTWTTVATYVRNFTINLVLITATVSVILLMPRLLRWLGRRLDTAVHQVAGDWQVAGFEVAEHWSLALALALASVAALLIADSLRLAALDQDHDRRWRTSQGGIQWLVVMPIFLASVLAAHWLGSSAGGDWGWRRWVVVTSIAYALPFLLYGWRSAVLRGTEEPDKRSRWILANSAMALVGILVGGGGGFLIFKLKELWQGDGIDSWALLTLGPPAIIVVFTLGVVVLIGLAGRDLDDYLREWLARGGAWIMIYSLAWLGLLGVTNYGPLLIVAAGDWGSKALASGWLAASIGGVLAGNAQQQGASKKWHGPLLKVAPGIFILGLVLLLAWGLDAGLSREGETRAQWKRFNSTAAATQASETLDYRSAESTVRVERFDQPSTAWLEELNNEHLALLDAQLNDGDFLYWMGALLVLALLLGWRVDVNEFSMHNYYRNRLVRAFLGASNPNRREHTQPFTGIARSDDSDLGTAENLRPYHLVNTALNLVGGDRLAWQQRKAASFLLAPLYCGFELPPGETSHGVESAFRATTELPGLTLGTALAISGAAASPNMGFRSSPALTLLLTVFNVRLGWWLGNPKSQETWDRLTPLFALKPLLAELFGLTSVDSNYVYLSDGGHFENLGIYELVRRRCRFIIASDVGTDPDLAFADLGNAIRKCRNDFGADIDIDVATLKPGADGMSRRHCVMGKIRYAPKTPGGLSERGWLLYIKSSLTGDEPEDVLQYKQANKAFPHQSTIDQFFDESQFESYRQLGRHVGRQIFESASREVKEDFTNWYSLFDALQQRWHAPSAAVEKSFAKHGHALDQLFERLRSDPKLSFLDGQIYGELGDTTTSRAPSRTIPRRVSERRAGFYFCSSLIQLMENVYLDLNLDEDHEHPDNQGWMGLFRRWAKVPMMEMTWAVSASTFGNRFQSFCERFLHLKHSKIAIDEAATDPAKIERIADDVEGDIGKRILELPGDPVITWHKVIAEAPGRNFPIGLAVLRHREPRGQERAPVSELIYYGVDSHLRNRGLARKGLRRLRRYLGEEGTRMGGGELKLVELGDQPEGIDEASWHKFRHFYNGALGGYKDPKHRS